MWPVPVTKHRMRSRAYCRCVCRLHPHGGPGRLALGLLHCGAGGHCGRFPRKGRRQLAAVRGRGGSVMQRRGCCAAQRLWRRQRPLGRGLRVDALDACAAAQFPHTTGWPALRQLLQAVFTPSAMPHPSRLQRPQRGAQHPQERPRAAALPRQEPRCRVGQGCGCCQQLHPGWHVPARVEGQPRIQRALSLPTLPCSHTHTRGCLPSRQVVHTYGAFRPNERIYDEARE